VEDGILLEEACDPVCVAAVEGVIDLSEELVGYLSIATHLHSERRGYR
jgi:hypothetical protein